MDRQTYLLCGVPVSVESGNRQQARQIWALWQQLFAFQKGDAQPPAVLLQFKPAVGFSGSVSRGQVVFESVDLSVLKTEAGFCFRCGASVLDLDLSRSLGIGFLEKSFWHRSLANQREFFLLSFLMLLRRYGLYGMHANGVSKEGTGCLIVGNSGFGKTTLTLSLIRSGWHYLSDDAVMLRNTQMGIEAMAFRRGFSCTQQTADFFPELSPALDRSPPSQNDKSLLDVESLYSSQSKLRCRPRLLLFPEITGGQRSRLIPIDETRAITGLIRQSPGILVDRPAVSLQIEVLKRLVHQAHSYQLLLGTDVYQEPKAVSELLGSTMRENNGQDRN